ncbi:MAG: hypothetical protein B6V02_03940 [Thermoprotei archaeon ex4572_64]|nr:MAG: hypothetical protein B6V02_03940 [Thermoprotei archaeon ex4572_64]
MYIAVLTRNINGWGTQQLIKAISSEGYRPLPVRFGDIYVRIDNDSYGIYVQDIDLVREVKAVIVRPIGKCSLDQAIFRVDLLHALEELGVTVINKASAIEKAIDKYRALHILRMNGIPVPPTVIAEKAVHIYRSSRKYLQNCMRSGFIIKPLFGSRGFGILKFSRNYIDHVWRITTDLEYLRHVIYVQKYLRHGGRDIRIFTIDNEVVAAMYREARYSWKTNIAQGGKPVPLSNISKELKEIAIKTAEVLECEVAGIDIIETKDGYYVIEVNSQPGFKALQEVTGIDIAKKIVKYVISKIKN